MRSIAARHTGKCKNRPRLECAEHARGTPRQSSTAVRHPPKAPTVSRRSALAGTTFAASALALLNDAVGADNPAANVADRASTIKITGLKASRVGTKAYIKVETSHGIFGWGEVTGLEPDISCMLARSLFELLDGENPTRIEHLWQKIYRSHRNIRGGSFLTHTLSAIDVALWDIAGKLHGVPVYRLLGGPVRDKIRLYNTPKAHKTGTGGPHPFSGCPRRA